MKKLFLSISLLLISLPSIAAWTPSSSSAFWSPWTQVTTLYPNNAGLIFNTAAVETIQSTCDGGSRFFLPATHPNYHVLAGIIIMAFNNQTEITIHLDENESPSCARVIDHFRVR